MSKKVTKCSPKGDRNRKKWPTPFCGTLSWGKKWRQKISWELMCQWGNFEIVQQSLSELSGQFFLDTAVSIFQQFPRITSIGSLPSENPVDPAPHGTLRAVPVGLCPSRTSAYLNWCTLKTLDSLNKESRLLTFHFSKATIVFGDNEPKCSKYYDRKAKITFGTSKCCDR